MASDSVVKTWVLWQNMQVQERLEEALMGEVGDEEGRGREERGSGGVKDTRVGGIRSLRAMEGGRRIFLPKLLLNFQAIL